jgi:hypothetical protein
MAKLVKNTLASLGRFDRSLASYLTALAKGRMKGAHAYE